MTQSKTSNDSNQHSSWPNRIISSSDGMLLSLAATPGWAGRCCGYRPRAAATAAGSRRC